MKKITKSSLAAIMAVSITGCVSNQPMDDQSQTKAEGTAVGALLGAALGYAMGDGEGAVVGGIVGAGAGYVVGSEIAERKQKYANEEEFLDGEIAYLAEYNQNAADYNSKLTAHIEKLDKRVAALKNEYEKGMVGYSKISDERKGVQERLKKSKQLLADLEKEYEVNAQILAEQKKGGKADDPSIARLEQEIAALKQNIGKLQQGTEQLASIDERLSV